MLSDLLSKKSLFTWLIICITIVALILRIICCFWGTPLQLHPDEPATVDYAMELLARHSWEVQTYNRPDHFEVKCDAVIFTVYSLIKYHTLPYNVFEDHKMDFYVLARIYTSLFGTAIIPLSAIYVGQLLKGQKKKMIQTAQLVVSFLTGFSSIFVQNSAYATPDIVLAFFVLLFSYFVMLYLENGSPKYLSACSIIIGIGITIKYPAAILCFPLACMVIYRNILEHKKPLEILKKAFRSILLIGATVFIIAPNLITNIYQVYLHIVIESEPDHLSAGGLGFGGNMFFYLKSMFTDIGFISVLFACIGIVFAVMHNRIRMLSLCVGVMYWICISVLSLHWLRWGIPIYPFYFITVAIGCAFMICFIDEQFQNSSYLHIVLPLAYVPVVLLLLSVTLSGVCITKYSTLKDLRNTVSEYLNGHTQINRENTLYEVYTPFDPNDGIHAISCFYFDDDHNLCLKEGYESKQYLMISSSAKMRYFMEQEKYPVACEIYEEIDKKYKIVYQEIADGGYVTDMSIIKNIISSVTYLLSEKHTAGGGILGFDRGGSIVIYDMKSGTAANLSPENAPRK